MIKMQYKSNKLVLVCFLLSFLACGFNASAQLQYNRTLLTGQTYTQLTGPGITIINTTAGLTTGVMSANQDDGAAIVTLPFTFTYGGNTFTTATFCTNGWVGMGSQTAVTAAESRAPANLFIATAPNNTISPWFRDMGANFASGFPGSMRHGLIGTDVYAFQWDQACGTGFDPITTALISFQVNIYGPASATPGRIEMIYGPAVGTPTTSTAVGLEDGVSGVMHFLNALNNSTTSTATSSAWPGNGNGYAFDPGTPTATSISSTANGGLWSNPATWVGGVVPGYDDVTIADGATVVVDGTLGIKSLSIGGTLAWGGSSFAMNVAGNVTINANGKLFAHTTGLTGQTLNIGGNFTNNGYANLAAPSTLLSFNGTQLPGGTSGQTLGGTGTFAGNGTSGLIRSLFFQSNTSSTISTTQSLVTGNFAHTAGTLNTNGLLTLDNTAQVYGQALNISVQNLVVTAAGSSYAAAPEVSGTSAAAWVASTAVTVGNIRVSGGNVYLVSVAGTTAATAPTHTSGTASNGTATLLWVGTTGTIGNPFLLTVTSGTQYFYGGNLYTCTAAGTASAAAPPTHISGIAASGTASFLYVGSPATASVQYDATTQTVRALNLTNAGSGYSSAPTISFVPTSGGSGATATAVYVQQIAGLANSTTQKSGSATISGALTINNNQNASLFSGVGALSTSNGGVNYTVAPTVGFAGPTAINLVTNGGSGFTSAPTVTVTGGNLVSGSALTTSSFTITVANGKVVSVYLNTSTSACYSTAPTLSFTGGGGSGASLAFPAGCWPAATAVIGSNRQITDFVMTNAGYGYVSAPTCGVGTSTATANGGTFTTVATAPTARVALYNVTYNNFIPSPAATANTQGVEIPANHKLNVFTMAGGPGANFSSDIEVFNSSPLTLTTGIVDMGGNNLWFSHKDYSGTAGTATSRITNGSVQLTSPGGSVTRTFPFAGIAAATGTGSLATGSTITSLKAKLEGTPSGAVTTTGTIAGSRSYRIMTPNAGEVYGTSPTVTLTYVTAMESFNSFIDNTNLVIAQGAGGITGPWTIRSAASGTGALSTTSTKATGTSAPNQIVPTGDDYYAWATTLVTCSGAPNVPVAATTASAICAGGTKVLTATGISTTIGITNQWMVSSTPGGPYVAVTGGTGAATTSYTTAALSAGTYYYVLASTCSYSATTVNSNELTVVVNALPNITITPSNNGSFCGTGTLTASGASTYTWTPVASLVASTGTTVTSTATANTTFTVTGTDANGCVNTATQNIVYTGAAPAITATSSQPYFCGTGGVATITATSTAAYDYTWTSLDGAALTNQTLNTVDADVQQTSAIQVTGIEPGTGCSNVQLISIGVYPLPTATVTTSATGVCPGTTATINSGLSAGNFSAACTTAPAALTTPPANATVLCTGGVAGVTLSGGTLDDGYWNTRPIGFTFNYFGTPYTTINVNTNGALNFGTTATTQFSFTGGFPSTANPANTIAACARDLQLTTTGGNFGFGGGTVRHWTEGVAPNRKFILQYVNCATWYSANANDGKSTVEVVLYETLGTVDIRVIEASNPAATTGTWINDTRNKYIGLQNGTQTIGATAPNCSVTPNTSNYWNGVAAVITSPQAWKFAPPSNYTTTWFANGTQIATGTNIFSQTVSPSTTTTYSISYTNQTTGCTNAQGSAEVTMQVNSTIPPSGVNATAPTSVCGGANIDLSLDYVVTTGITLQWQVSTDGGANWTNISGATNTTATTTQTVASQYRCEIVACGGTPGYSSVADVSMKPVTDCYCTASYSTGTGSGDFITLVQLGTINNATGASTTPFYTFYNNMSTNLSQGGTYTLTLSAGTYTSNDFAAWIDYDHNGVFDAAEKLGETDNNPAGPATATITFTVPNTSLNGPVRLRIVEADQSSTGGMTPCGAYTFGETEDYMVDISTCPSVTATASASATSVCTGSSITFTAATTGGSSYQWTVNGGAVTGETNNTFVSSSLSNGDVVGVTVSNGCNNVVSNGIAITINPIVTPAVSASASAASICAGTSVTFTAMGTDGGSSPMYQWMLNSAAISGATDATYSSSTLANGDEVSVMMTSNAACATSATATSNAIQMMVTPVVTPSVSATATSTSICAGTSVTFDATSSNGGATPSYQWMVNGNNAGTGTSFSSSSLSNGDVVSVMMTSNAACATSATATSNSFTMNVGTVGTPSVSVNASTNMVCDGGTATLVAVPSFGGNAPAYQWYKNGSPITGATNFNYTAAGINNGDNFAVKLTSNAGCITTATAMSSNTSIGVYPSGASITANGSTTICSTGGTVTLTAGQGVDYTWNTGATTQSINVTTPGNYYVLVTSANGCVDQSSVTAVTTKVMPNAIKIKAVGATTVCAPNTVPLILDMPAGSTTGFAYQWKRNGVAIPGANDSTYNVDTIGSFSVTVSGAGTCNKSSTAKTVTVKPLPVANFTVGGPTEFCTGGSVMFTAPSMPGYTYTWLNNGANAGSGATKTFKISGTFSLVATLTGCKDTSNYSETVTVNPLPVAAITTNDPTTFCAGGSATLLATPTGTGYSYDWKNGTTAVGTTSMASYLAMNSGAYKVMVTDNKGCVSKLSTSKVTLKVNPIPTPTIAAQGSTTIASNGNVKLKATPTSGVTWQWYLNGNAITGATAKDYIATAGGDYTVAVTKLGCTGTSAATTVTQTGVKEEEGTTSNPAGTEEAAAIFELSAFPNPVSGILNINVRGIEEVDAVLHVMDMNGKLVTMKEMHEASATVDMTGYANGMYLIRYKDNQGRTGTIKVNKQ